MNQTLEMLEEAPVVNKMQLLGPTTTKRMTIVHEYWRWLSSSGSTTGSSGTSSSTTDEDGSKVDDDDSSMDDFDDNENASLLFANDYECEARSPVLASSIDEENDYMMEEQFLEERKVQQDRRRQRQSSWNWTHLWSWQLLPEGPWKLGKNQILFDEIGVKLFKFFAISAISILLIHYYAIYMDADHDESYGLRELILFDGNHIALDVIVFFVVGRLYETPAVDNLGWIVPSIGAALTLSILASNADSLHHSITAYEIHCTWTWQFWIVILCGVCPTLMGLIIAHLVYASRQQAMLQKLVELFLGFAIFLLPYCFHSFFHLHHWYYAWILGMHANAKTWWSRLTMSIMWGIYLNGIAIFGRDPIMTCAVTLYQAQNQQCPFLSSDSTNFTWDVLETSSSPALLDWRDCSNTHPNHDVLLVGTT